VTWTYDPALTTERDWIRLLSGDTDQVTPRVADEAIDGMLAQYAAGSLFLRRYAVSAEVARICAGAVANLVDKTKSDVHKMSSQLQRQFTARAEQLDAAANAMTGGVSPGLDRGTRELTRTDTSLNPPYFTDDLHDNPRAPQVPAGMPALPLWGGFDG
jgi:hypothetical protein